MKPRLGKEFAFCEGSAFCDEMQAMLLPHPLRKSTGALGRQVAPSRGGGVRREAGVAVRIQRLFQTPLVLPQPPSNVRLYLQHTSTTEQPREREIGERLVGFSGAVVCFSSMVRLHVLF